MSNTQELLNFINKSKTAFQSACEIKSILDKEGYAEIKEEDTWNLEKGGKYYIKKNDSAVIAFQIGTGDIEKDGRRRYVYRFHDRATGWQQGFAF